MLKKRVAFLAGACLLAASAAMAAGVFTNGVPPAGGTQYPTTLPLTGNETVPADTNLSAGVNPASEAVSVNQLASNDNAQPTRNNALIGGDAGTNLWQRNTTGSSVTTTLTYGGPDRWAYWSGTGTAMTVSRSTTAGDLPAGYQAAFKMARTSGQTGVVQVCMAQEVISSASYQFAGGVAELDFHAVTGANYSAASANMTAYIITGTGTNEGMVNLAFGLNAGGGGSAGWTGQTNATAAVISLGGVSTAGRYAAVANIPAAATEIAVALCFTPVGTAGTNDYIAFSGIQLIRNPANKAYASASVGYNATTFPAAGFERRSPTAEAELQYAYFYRLNEPASGAALPASCQATGASANICNVNLPVPMRATTPTIAITTAGTFKVNIAGTPTTIASPTASTCSSTACAVTAGNTNTAGQAELLSGGGGTGAWDVSAEL